MIGVTPIPTNGSGLTTRTILNISKNTVNGTIQYYNTDGTKQDNTHQFTIGPNASQLAYQGDVAAKSLPSGLYGTTIETENGCGQDLKATTNAALGWFYIYTEPLKSKIGGD